MTRPLTIASQLPEAWNTDFARLVPGLTITAIPRGIPASLPEGTEVLLASPTHGSAARRHQGPPPGWPESLRWIQLSSAGADGYPEWLLRSAVVSCARGPSAEPLAEFALAAIFAAAKQMPEIWINEQARWTPSPRLAMVRGARLGLFGFGAVGRSLAEKALALGMEVVALRRSDAPLDPPGVTAARDLHDLFAQSDHLVLAAPWTPETNRIIDAGVLAHAKPGLHLVNVARGALIDDEALLQALAEGRIGRATLDSTDPEPLPDGHPFYTHPQIRLSPHLSMHSPIAFSALIEKIARNSRRYQAGQTTEDIVDLARGY